MNVTPIRIATEPNGKAVVEFAVTLPDGQQVRFSQPLTEERAATLLTQLAAAMQAQAQERAKAYRSPLRGYDPPKAYDPNAGRAVAEFVPGIPAVEVRA